MTQAQTFHQFYTTFQQLADKAGIAQKDCLNDIYNKLPPAFCQTLIVIKCIVMDNFQLFCDLVGKADGDLRRLHKKRFEYNKACATTVTTVNTPTSAPTTRTSVPAVTLNRASITVFAYTTSAIFNPFVKTTILNSTKAKCFNCEKVGHFVQLYILL